MAKRLSVSTCRFRVRRADAELDFFHGNALGLFDLAANLLMMSMHSCGTELEPCMTRWQFGRLAVNLDARSSIASTSPVGLPQNL